MRIQSKKTTSSNLRIDDNFATLLSIEDDGACVYEFRYYSDTINALKMSANIVKITIRKELPVASPDVFKTIRASGDVRSFVNDILTTESRVKDAARDAKSTAVFSAKSDLTATFNNELTRDVKKSNALGTKRIIALKSVTQLKQQNIEPPVLQTSTFKTSKPSQGQFQLAATELIFRGVDPSIVGSANSPVNGTHSAFSGYGATTSRGSTDDSSSPIARKHDILATSLHAQTAQQFSTRTDMQDKTLVPVFVDVTVKQILNKKVMRIPATVIDDFFVIFELLDTSGVTHETLTKKVPHGLLTRVFNTPKTPPRVEIAPFQFHGKNVIEIEQTDPHATSVRIMRRRIQKSLVDSSNTTYVFVAEIPLKKRDGLFKFIDIVNNSSTLLYRCIPVGLGGIIGAEFTNAVSQAMKFNSSIRYHRSFAAALNVKTVNGGLVVSVTDVPAGVIAASILKRDLTIFETEYAFLDISDPIRLIGSSLLNMTFMDSALKENHIYEYKCMLYFEDGSNVFSTAHAMKRYIPLAIGSADVDVLNLQVIRDSVLDVRFDIISKLADENFSKVQKLLEKQGSTSLYADELKNERSRLENLIAHQIIRIDVTTGTEESFGTFIGTAFSDVTVGSKQGVSKLKEGHKYRYVISTVTRSAETMFDDFKKDAVDTSTGKKYQFKPSVFLHPYTLKRGTLVTRETLVSNHPEDDFSYGHMGNSHEIEVTIDTAIPKIDSVKSMRIDRRTAVVQWNVNGPADKIDHFIIMKENLGQSSVIGKMHNVSQGNTFEFFDTITPDDIGEISYRVITVMNDYTRGVDVISSNKLKIVDIRGIGAI